MKVLIVDDEPTAQEILEHFCSKMPLIEKVVLTDRAQDAFDKLRKESFDILFLDIQMPGMDGLTLARYLLGMNINIIFTTAYSEYALDAFELNVVDYLMKPFSFDRFEKAVQKSIGRMNPNSSRLVVEKESSDALFFKIEGEFQKCLFADISYLEAIGNYTKIHRLNLLPTLMIYSSLKQMEETLSPLQFCRIHNSYIVSLAKIEMVCGNMVRLSSNIELPIARNRKENLYERLHLKD